MNTEVNKTNEVNKTFMINYKTFGGEPTFNRDGSFLVKAKDRQTGLVEYAPDIMENYCVENRHEGDFQITGITEIEKDTLSMWKDEGIEIKYKEVV